jgi:coniferyl-aldehyde dehydrogenase
MQDEIFGPLLPIKTYQNFEETIAYINQNPRPLAAYYFGQDPSEEKRFLTGTTSGGVCINDVMFHMLQKDLPFGGIGPSGMGAYHGIEGFKTFSHAKAIYRQTRRFNVAKLAGLLPPYGDASEKNIVPVFQNARRGLADALQPKPHSLERYLYRSSQRWYGRSRLR